MSSGFSSVTREVVFIVIWVLTESGICSIKLKCFRTNVSAEACWRLSRRWSACATRTGPRRCCAAPRTLNFVVRRINRSSSVTQGLCIPYVVRATPNKGRGLFAEAAIPKGTTVWRHVAGQYAVYDERSLKALLSNMPNSEAVYVLEHIHCMPEFPDYMIWVLDDGELINHSEQPTLLTQTRPGYNEGSPATSTKDVSIALLGDHFTLVAARDAER